MTVMHRIASNGGAKGPPANHRTVDRVTQIVEEVVARPGISFTELALALDAAKSSVHGFIQGLMARGWLYEQNGGFYLGPAVYALTLACGNIRAGIVTGEDLAALHAASGVAAFLGVRAGDDLIYVAETGSDPVIGFDAQTKIRRTLLQTAGGKVLLAELPKNELNVFLRRRSAAEAEDVDAFLAEYSTIRDTGLARNLRQNGTRFALATAVRDSAGTAVGAITLVGPSADMLPREAELQNLLLDHVAALKARTASPREAI